MRVSDIGVWGRIGLLGFGGPAGQIALLHKEVVETRGWLSESEFQNALGFCALLPGPEAHQLAIYCGFKRAGLLGALTAGTLFVLPGLLIILSLSVAYWLGQAMSGFQAVFLGLKAAVIVLVAEALWKMGQKVFSGVSANHGVRLWIGLALSALALFLGAPFGFVALAGGVYGALLLAGEDRPVENAMTKPWPGRALVVLGVGIGIWLLPLLALTQTYPADHPFVQVGGFFARTIMVTFGGAYAILGHVAKVSVQEFHWLSSAQMADGLGLAETTPGPLILVMVFIATLAGAKTSVLTGILTGLLAAWVVFVPSFWLVLAGAPHLERLTHNGRLKGALKAISAVALVSIVSLALVVVKSALFPRFEDLVHWGGLDLKALGLVVMAVVLMRGARFGAFRLTLCLGLLGYGTLFLPAM